MPEAPQIGANSGDTGAPAPAGGQEPEVSQGASEVVVAENAPHTTQVILRRSAAGTWAVAAVFLGAIAAATFLIYTFVYSVPAKVIETGGAAANTVIQEVARVPDRLAAAFKPNISVNTVVSSGIENAKRSSKLVVLTADVDVEIDKSSEMRVLWDTFKLSDATVRLRVRDNKVQYVIPLSDFSKDQVSFSPDTNCLLVTVPEPRLDTEMVEVQSDPAAIEAQTDVGWGRLLLYNGDDLMDEAKRELRGAVLREGTNPLLKEKARTEAESAVRALFKDWVPSLRNDVKLQVKFG